MATKTTASKTMKENMTDKELSHKYQKKTDKQHVLDTPDTYTGSMSVTDYETFVMNDAIITNVSADTESSSNTAETIMAKQIAIVPGLYKIVDEAIVNARDHVVRMKEQIEKTAEGGAQSLPVTEINITIDAKEGIITIYNNGNGIDVAKHPSEDVWIPELIFAHLRTSTNYDKEAKKTTGGKNGFGIKLAFIWSSWAKIETIDHVRGLKYVQEFADNLNVIKPPTVTKCSKKPCTLIAFKPDFKRMGLPGLTSDMLALLKRRVFDLAAVTDKTVKVKYNDAIVPVKNFLHYVDLYVGDKATTSRVHEEANERWEYVVCMAPKEEFTQVSFVNGIFTGKGGKHVDYILNQFVRKMTAFIKQKKKVDVKPNTIKEQIFLFVRCVVENPAFDSQTKDYMNTPVASFGSTCEISDKFIEKAAKLGIMDAACALTDVKTAKTIKTKDGVKSKSVRGIPKLVDANDAGGSQSDKCILILCEGDSAKAGIMSGLSTTDRNTIGVYPLRGKLFNVRGEAAKRISEVKEIHEIKQIIGLEAGKKYTPEEAKKLLRYGKVLFMTDQDLDGSHIKGLCINLFDSEWATLLAIPGFIGFMNTPIIKARKGTQEKLFYNDGEYEQWKTTNSASLKGWSFKYYKGLGTSTGKEFKEYFANKKIVNFVSTGEGSRDAIDKVFNKKRASDRKEWLENYDRSLYLDTNRSEVPYEEFISQEMIHFSKYDCERSIPNGIDGLKTSQRKILFTCLERRLTNEIKVAQLGGSVSEKSRYHHGEQSLYGAIINMAQNYVGSNNINLLEPNGQFGTRLQGGDDAASERYICTQLNKLTRLIYPEADDAVLTYLEDDGTPVEPMFYVPIIPMQLVNGGKGIGTGFSTDILNYNPLVVMDYVEALLKGQPAITPALMPYYTGFKGQITLLSESKYLIKGVYQILSDKQVRVTELPIGTWTDDYKKYIEELIEAKPASETASSADDKKKKPKKMKATNQVKDYIDMSTDTTVDITLTFAPGIIPALRDEAAEQEGCTALEKLLKLYTTRSTTNMHVFDEKEKLIKCDKVEELVERYMKVRMDYYVKRKAHQVVALEKESNILSNKARFISELLEDTLDLRKKKTAEVSALLKARNYSVVDEDADYKYLVRLPMDSVTEENVNKIMQERDRKNAELLTLKDTTETQLWLHELAILRKEYLIITSKAAAAASTSASIEPKKVKITKKN
jgi:DNA topoisomerase-2